MSTTISDQYWKDADRETLIGIANGWACGWSEEEVFPAEEGDWEYVPDFPVSKLLSVMSSEEWRDWVAVEDSADLESGRDPRCKEMIGEDIWEPIVLSLNEKGEVHHIWDGWHRSGASVVKGAAGVRAIVGVHKPELVASRSP